MRIRLDVESGFLFLFVAVSSVAVIQALGFVYPANLLPLVVGIPTLALSIAAVAQHWSSAASAPTAVGGAADDAGASTRAEPRLRREAGTVGWVVGAGLLMWTVGIAAAIPCFVFLYGAIVGRMPWTRSALLGLGVGAGVYALFVGGLGMQFAPGWIWAFV